MDYEQLRDNLIQEMRGIKEPESGESLVNWACRREDLYRGEHISKYPDIIFELRDEYGVGWVVHEALIGMCQTHNIQPGSHKGDSAVMLLSAPGDEVIQTEDITMMDIAPTVLHLLGIQGSFSFDGKSFLGKQ